jgi:hypothetical protein
MEMVCVPVWIWRSVGVPTDIDTNMHAVMPVGSAMALMLANIGPVMADIASVTTVMPSIALGLARIVFVRLGPVSRAALDVRARSRRWLGKRGGGHGDEEGHAGDHDASKDGFKHT